MNYCKFTTSLCLVLLVFTLASPVMTGAEIKVEVKAETKTVTVDEELIEPENKAVERFNLVFDTPEIETILVERLNRSTLMAKEIKETYAIKNREIIWGYLIYDTYSFKNGDLYYYMKYTPWSNQAGDISLLLPFAPEQFDLRTIEYPKGLDQSSSIIKLYEKQSVADNVLSSLLPGSVYIDSEDLNCFFSYTSVYEKYPYQIREELYEKSISIPLSANGFKISLPAGGNSFSEQWGILSHNELVNWSDMATVDAIRVADLSRVRKWGGDGSYYTLPVGYSPYSANGFYRNNANHIGDKFIRSTGGMFEDFGYVTMDTLIKTQTTDGFWGTSPRSDWLYKDYKIGAGFFDTRWDTEAAFFLLKGYRRFKEPQALEAASAYANFYCNFALSHSYKTINGGILVYDYGFDAIPGIKTHVSLNHLISEMNFLLEMYITTQDQSYLDVADRILTGVRDTGSSWVNKVNGDLHYAYLVNGKYGLIDYPTLTLNDLRYAQSLIRKVYEEEETTITKLIEAKEKYLKAHKIAYY